MRSLRHNRAGAFLVAIAIAAAATAGAFAYWQGSGSGSASTVLPDVQALSLEPGNPTAELYPGGDSSVGVLVSNPNSTFVQVGSIVLDPGAPQPFAVDSEHNGCDIAALSFVTQDNGGAGWRIPPRAGSTDGSLAIEMPAAMQMSLAAANACQGATFTVQLKASL
jgi:hypothetical protein